MNEDGGVVGLRYIVAVSGGVDSVVLLDRLIRHGVGTSSLIVAHVDHGIRPESAEDARFVETLAQQYGLPFEMIRLELGANASEELARRERYAFLRRLAATHRAHIVTAHHADDVVETVAINLVRGTGWRGLAVFGAHDIYRPMTTWFKHEVIAYAKQHGLTWREDATNQNDTYLRNRLRVRATTLAESEKLEILALWRTQREVRREIDRMTERLASHRRHPYIMAPDAVAAEVLRRTIRVPLTRPQIARALLAIKVARPGSLHDLNAEYALRFGTSDFTLVEHKK